MPPVSSYIYVHMYNLIYNTAFVGRIYHGSSFISFSLLQDKCSPKVSQRPGRLLAARRVPDRMDRPVAMSDPLGKSRHRQEQTSGCKIPIDHQLKSRISRWIDHL